MAEQAGCSQSAVSKHINGKLTGWEKCGRKRCKGNRDDRSLEQTDKKSRFKNLGKLYKEWNDAGVKASGATPTDVLRERSSLNIKLLLNQRQHHKHFTEVRK